MPNEIIHINEYIQEIAKKIHIHRASNATLVYRGEAKAFKAACIPNIYRESYLKQHEYFEKNIFDEMRANKIAKGDSYLENAISAQHDGFPSRLLDVTYNSLVALYFACTPYYRYAEDKYDDYDGKVFVFFIEKSFCPTGDNTTKNYEELITNKQSFVNQAVFSKNHKLIDHIKINNRIIAQQGAFILFQGDEAEPIPPYMYEELTIPHTAKPTLRKELKELFGVYTGSIYPEAENLIDEIKKKSLNIENSEFNINSEMKILLQNLQCEINHYVSNIFIEPKKDVSFELVKALEKIVKSYQLGIMEVMKTESFSFEYIKQYNELISEMFDDIDSFFGDKIETSKGYFMIEGV